MSTANELIWELLRMSQSHIDDATDPDTPEALFKPYLRIGAVSGQAALLLDAVLKRDPVLAEELASEVAELATDGEVLVSWVGEQLNTRELI